MCYVRLTTERPSNDGRSSAHRDWVTPTLIHTQHYNVLRTTYGENIWATTERSSAMGLGTPTLGQTQHYNVLRATYHQTSEPTTEGHPHGIGYPSLSVKLNTVTCYARLTTKHPSNDRSSSATGLGTPHTESNSTSFLDMFGGHCIYCHICTAMWPYSIHNYHCFFTEEEPCQKGWAVCALGLPLRANKFGNGAHHVTPYSLYFGEIVYMHIFTPIVYGKFAWSHVANLCPSFQNINLGNSYKFMD